MLAHAANALRRRRTAATTNHQRSPKMSIVLPFEYVAFKPRIQAAVKVVV